jgi:YfiR/HmsC-like
MPLIPQMLSNYPISRYFKFLFLWVVAVGLGTTLYGQTLEVPADVQVSLLLKATTYDRAFASKLKKNEVLHVGICYQEKNRVSVKEMEDLKIALSKPINGFKIHVTPIAINEHEDFARLHEWEGLSVMYITSMRALDLAGLLTQAHKHKVLTVSTDPHLAAKGVSMSFELVGSRPKFVINRNGATSEGCDFSSQLLKLATIY